jgi:predicted 2-oxoglutarate/Fe(II)-dependent dioxygenase YbiX
VSSLWGIEQEDIFLTGFNILSRSKDIGMAVHSDGGDGLRQKTLYGLVLYLNTCDVDFWGGELYYPNLKIEYKPKAGDLVIHPGSEEYRHGVNDVTLGTRYIITSFAKTVQEY